jgi:hypothetical protein
MLLLCKSSICKSISIQVAHGFMFGITLFSILCLLCLTEKTDSCLDPKFPGTCRKGVVRDQARPTLGKRVRVSWNPAEISQHEKRQGRPHSGCHDGGSAANRVRRLLSLFTKCIKEVTCSISYLTVVVVFSFMKINHLVLHHLH